MREIIMSMLMLTVGANVSSGQSYFFNHRGKKVELIPAADRIAVRLTSKAWSRIRGMSEFDLEAGVVMQGDLSVLPLHPHRRGKGPRLIRMLLEKGFAERAGEVFREPGGTRTVTLDRDVLVKLRQPTLPPDLLEQTGLQILDRMGSDRSTLLCRAASTQAALQAAVRATEWSEVVWAIPDFHLPVDLFHRPNDRYYSEQWYHLQASSAHIHSEEAWDVTMGDPRVIVAVIDTGVQEDHPDFDPARLVTGYNTIDDTNDPTPQTASIDAHGTACAGAIVASADNHQGIAGVCPRCSLMGIKMMDGVASGTQISNGYKAFDYARENGAWVISNSWGNIPEDMLGPYYDAVRDAVQNGRDGKGAVVLFSSGNGDPPSDPWAVEIKSYELQNMPEIMAVGGTGPDDQHVSYSNYGPNLSVVAPTGEIDPSNANNPFDGPQIFTTDTFGNSGGMSRNGSYFVLDPDDGQDTEVPNIEEPDGEGHYTAYFRGTSAACPIAAGVVALALSANPDLTGEQARFIVEQTADKVGTVTYNVDGHHDKYGHGRVNAARAVQAALVGFDNIDGSVCTEHFNCAGEHCARKNSTDPEGFCATLCETGADCSKGQNCISLASGPKLCLEACSSHTDCSGDSVCQDQVCQKINCMSDDACPDDMKCGLDAYCVLKTGRCMADRDCSEGFRCTAGHCYDPDAAYVLGGCGCGQSSVTGSQILWLLFVLGWIAVRLKLGGGVAVLVLKVRQRKER